MATDFKKRIEEKYRQELANMTVEERINEKYQRELRAEGSSTTKKKKKDEEEDIAPVKERGYWSSEGLLSDGYDRWDVAKTLLGTTADTGLGIVKGAGNMLEGVNDWLWRRTSDVAELVGADEFAKKAEAYAEPDTVNKLLKPAEDFIAPYTVNGELARQVSEGLGQVGAFMAGGAAGAAVKLGKGALTALTTGTSFMSSAGSNEGQALKEGATEEEARTYGTIAGASDALSELLFGGLGKSLNIVGMNTGLSSADDMLAKKASKMFNTQLTKNIAEYGVKASGEGFEEVIAGVAQAVGKKLTYMEEEELGQILNDEDLLNQFVVGAVTSGIVQSKGLVKSTKAGRDYITDLTENEQKVIDAETANRSSEKQKERAIQAEIDKAIKDREDVSGELTEEGRKAVREETLQRLKDAEIDFSSVELTKKERAEIENQVREDFDKGYIDIATIENTLFPQKAKRISELTAEMETADDLRKADIDKELKSLGMQLDGILNSNEKLKESYRQRALKKQDFQVEITEKDSEITKKLAEDFKKVGVGNNRKAHETFDFLKRVANDSGTTFKIVNGQQLQEMGYKPNTEGLIKLNADGSREIVLNVDQDAVVKVVAGHEITHRLETTNEFGKLQKILNDYAMSKGEYEARLERTKELYKDVKNADPNKELTAQLAGEYLLNDDAFVNQLSAKEPNIFKKVYEYIKHAYKMATAGSKEARQLEQAKRIYDKAYKQMSKATAQESEVNLVTDADSNTAYSLSDSDGRKLTKAQQEYFKESKVRDENGNLKVMYHGTPAGDFTVFKDGTYFTENKEYADRYQSPSASSISYGKEATNPKTFEVYLDIKKPFDINDPEAREIYINDYIKGGNAMGINPYLSDAEYDKIQTIDWTEGEDLRDFLIDEGYDYDGLVLDEGADGGYGEEVQYRGKSYVVFNANQIKNVDNTNPTSDSDIRFSLSEPVEQGKELVAVHNMKASELMKTLDLGGFPMPSIAVIKAQAGHGNYGDISVVFSKDTIDPKLFKTNKVYSGDAWTPEFPSVSYKADEKVASNIATTVNSHYNELPYHFQREVYSLSDYDNIDDKLNREGGAEKLKERYENSYGFKQLYLAEKGDVVPMAMKEKRTELTDVQKENAQAIIDAVGKEALLAFTPEGLTSYKEVRTEWLKKNRPAIEEAYSQLFADDKMTVEEAREIFAEQTNLYWTKEIRAAIDYLKTGGVTVEQVEDLAATKDIIDKKIDNAEYQKWFNALFKGLEGKSGIRNSKDMFTPSGNRRSWEALHDPITLDNVLKAMRGEEAQKGKGMFGGSMMGAATREFGSISDIKASSENLRIVPDEEMDAAKKYVNDTLYEIASLYAAGKNVWDAQDALIEAVASNETKSGIKSYLKQFDYVYKLNDDIVDDLVELRNYVRTLPTGYFEAKPRRAVGLDEIEAILVPNDADAELLSRLEEGGYNVVQYEAGNEADRTSKLNELDDLKFSIANDLAPTRGTRWSDILKDPVESPVETVEDIAPVREDVDMGRALTEEDLANMEAERAAAGMPDDYAPIAEEYFNLPDTAPLDKKSLKMISKNIKSELGLKNKQMPALEKIIQDFSTSETQDMGELYNAIEAEFGTVHEQVKLEEVREIKAALRSMPIKVSDVIKNDIADYFQFKQSNFGKIRFSNEGLAVDDVYEGLKDVYSEYFPADIINPTDQLLKIAEVANLDAVYTEEYFLPEEQIQEVAGFIYESIGDYKRNQAMRAVHEAGRLPIDESLIPPEVIEEETVKDVEETPGEVGETTKKDLRKKLLDDNKVSFVHALDNAKNRSMALMNNTDTIRNTELVFGREDGRIINEAIFQPAIDNEAKSIAWQNKERDEIKALGIKARSKEAAAVQKYGEGKYVNEYGDEVIYGDDELMQEFSDEATREKIKHAASVIRTKYDQYIEVANGVLTKLGFEPIPKRADYMRHFMELNDVFSRYGIPFNAQNMQEHTLPTDINGLTEFWSPQKNFFANIQPRKGKRTTLDAITGIDGYIGGIANLIYHTEDIQRGRAFEELIRETYGEEKGWDNLAAMEDLSPEEYQARADKIQDNHLSNYAAWVHEWTNNMAGKKNKVDRSIEAMFGRKAFSFLDQTRKQVGANMIGFNLSSSLTNLIAPVQAMAKTNKLAVAKGTADTIKNIFIKDNFMEKNNFLTARMGTDMLSKTAWEKIQDAGYIFMKGMDWFSSNQIVRSKYYELRSKGMSEEQAHAEAGKFAARIMGDRTKGAQAQMYNSKLIGLVTQFQLEVNNQLYSMFYDTYHESKENANNSALKTAAGMTFTLGQLFAFSHVFGKTFESIAGYNPTFDLIGMIATALGLGDDDEEKTTSERLKTAADQLVDALPYVNVLTGGGRIPVASGIPNVVGVMTGGKDEYGNELTWGGELEKLRYLVPPTGGNQVKKTMQGLAMFDEDLPVSGSYTDSGNLRFPVEDTPLNRAQAALFGQWASENANQYFDQERQPLKEKQIQEYKDLDIPIAEYWEYRDGLKDKETLEAKFDYVASLDLPVEKKNIMINNLVDRKEKVDLINYNDFGSYEEFDFAAKNPEKYSFLESYGVTYAEYNATDKTREAYNWAFENPESYTLSRAVSDVVTYRNITGSISDIRADKDSNGKTISGSAKAKKVNYINGLDVEYGAKLILFKSEYPSDDTYNYEIIDYLNNRQDISYADMQTILTKLGFTVDAEGNIYW